MQRPGSPTHPIRGSVRKRLIISVAIKPKQKGHEWSGTDSLKVSRFKSLHGSLPKASARPEPDFTRQGNALSLVDPEEKCPPVRTVLRFTPA